MQLLWVYYLWNGYLLFSFNVHFVTLHNLLLPATIFKLAFYFFNHHKYGCFIVHAGHSIVWNLLSCFSLVAYFYDSHSWSLIFCRRGCPSQCSGNCTETKTMEESFKHEGASSRQDYGFCCQASGDCLNWVPSVSYPGSPRQCKPGLVYFRPPFPWWCSLWGAQYTEGRIFC